MTAATPENLNPRSVDELFAIALAMEREAARRYRDLAEEMERQGRPALVTLFRRLQAEEQRHENGIADWARRHRIRPAEPGAFSWTTPECTPVEDLADAGGPQLLSPRRALDLAIHNEQRAFAFFTRVASATQEPELRGYAERMAKEELNHVALLRLERRRAWRRDAEEDIRPMAFSSRAGLADHRGRLETRLADLLGCALEAMRRRGDPRSPAIAGLLDDLGLAPSGPVEPSMELPAVLRAALRELETACESCLLTAEQAADEPLLLAAQNEFERLLPALERLSELLNERTED